ncbi:MAG: hypothetical protein RLZZ06_1046 [Actinomycetota bacterium]|jgi:hypothetical protein
MIRQGRALFLSVALVAGIGFVSPGPSASAAGCEATKPLSNATLTTTALPNGGVIRSYQFGPGMANSSAYAGRLAVAKMSLNFASVTPTHAKFGEAIDQVALAESVGALVHTNSDFFDFNSLMPYSAFGLGGSLDYSPQGSSTVLGVRMVAATAKTGIRAASKTSGFKKMYVAGLNLDVVNSGSIVAFNSSYPGTLPANSYGILLRGGKVSAVYPNGTTQKPTSGYLLAARGASVASLKSLSVGSTLSYTPPSGTIAQLVRDRIISNGQVTSLSGRVLASINGVNVYKSLYLSGGVLFTDEYSGRMPAGSSTVVVNGSNVVTRVSPTGLSLTVPSGYRVLQFYGTARNLVSSFNVGDRVVISASFRSASGKNYSTVFGVGNTIIKNGVVNASCAGSVDTIRPRTALGWDDSGHIYLATTTMGRDWPDGGAGGYRVGGSTVHQLADWLRALGATDGVALDGGGSTTMYAKVSGEYHRMDLPDGVWTRWVPVGIALTNR